MSGILSWFLFLSVGSSILVALASGTPTTALLSEVPELSMLPLSSMEMSDEKPTRPRLFQTAEQIRMYLDSLGKYYNYQNRNRFGKRRASSQSQTAMRIQVKQPKPTGPNQNFQDYEFRGPL